MALDRTWYNTLVDDDGSNTVGTIWNKAAVDSLMDAIDAALAALGGGGSIPESSVTNLVTDLAAKAALASPTFTGTPLAPTAPANTDTPQIATTAFVQGRDAVVTLTDGPTPALDASLGGLFILSAGGDRTIAVPTNPRPGQKIVIRHLASGAARTLALNTGTNGFRFGSDITALTQTAAGKNDYIGAIWNAVDSRWDVVAVTKGF